MVVQIRTKYKDKDGNEVVLKTPQWEMKKSTQVMDIGESYDFVALAEPKEYRTAKMQFSNYSIFCKTKENWELGSDSEAISLNISEGNYNKLLHAGVKCGTEFTLERSSYKKKTKDGERTFGYLKVLVGGEEVDGRDGSTSSPQGTESSLVTDENLKNFWLKYIEVVPEEDWDKDKAAAIFWNSVQKTEDVDKLYNFLTSAMTGEAMEEQSE